MRPCERRWVLMLVGQSLLDGPVYTLVVNYCHVPHGYSEHASSRLHDVLAVFPASPRLPVGQAERVAPLADDTAPSD